MKSVTKYYFNKPGSLKKILIGIKITEMAKGSTPLTEPTQPFQIVTLKHKKGTLLKAHLHIPTARKTTRLQECLFIKSGKVKIDLYTTDKLYIKSIFLRKNEVFLLIEGGYGIHIIKDSEIFEFKNGPFIEDKVLI